MRQRRIPSAIARKLSHNPDRSLLWRVAQRFYTRPAAFFKYLGVFPLPLQAIPYTGFDHLPFEPVREFPLGETPKSIYPTREWARWTTELPPDLQDQVIASCHTVFVRNGFADSQGNVFSADGQLVLGASLPVRKRLSDYYRPSRLFPPVYAGSSMGVLTSSLHDNYYHWIADILPRIHMLRSQELRPARLYVRTGKPFQADTLSLLRISDASIVSANEYDVVGGTTLVVPFHETKSRLELPRWVCEFLRNSFLPAALRLESEPRPSRLYVSREGAQWRRVVNEAEVMERLVSLGFRCVTLDERPFIEQVRLFHRAEVVIAPHGAGLVNLVFCQPGTAVIELQPRKLQNLFFKLSRTVGLEYYYVLSSTGPQHPANNQQQITVDMRELEQTLALAGLA